MRTLDWIFAARPMLLVPVWTIYLVALHYHHSLAKETFDLLDVASLSALSLAFAGAYYINQVYDIESDRLNNKVGFLPRGLIRPEAMLAAFVTVSLAGLFVAGGVSFWMLGLVAQIVVLSWSYSAPPVRFKDRPVSGPLANGWAVGLVTSLSVMPRQSLDRLGLLGWDNPVYFFLAVVAVTIITTIPDRDGDSATGKRTLAVHLGARWSLAVAAVCLGAAVAVAWRSGYPALVYAALFALVVSLFALAAPTTRLILLAAKVPIVVLTLMACAFYPFYLLFLVALILGTRIYYHKRFGIVYPTIA